MTPEIRAAMTSVRALINAQAHAAGVTAQDDWQADATICEDGQTLLLHVECGGHIFTASVPDFVEMATRAGRAH